MQAANLSGMPNSSRQQCYSTHCIITNTHIYGWNIAAKASQPYLLNRTSLLPGTSNICVTVALLTRVCVSNRHFVNASTTASDTRKIRWTTLNACYPLQPYLNSSGVVVSLSLRELLEAGNWGLLVSVTAYRNTQVKFPCISQRENSNKRASSSSTQVRNGDRWVNRQYCNPKS